MRSEALELTGRILEGLGALAWSTRRTSHLGRILMYHGVVEQGDANSVTPQEFRRQIELVAARCNVVPLAELVDSLLEGVVHPGKGGRPLAAITFDDGQVGTYRHAFPILRQLSMPATIFVVTDLLDGGGAIWTAEVNLIWQALRSAVHTLELPGGSMRLAPADSGWDGLVALKRRLKRLSRTQRADALAALRALSGPIHLGECERTITWDMAREMERSGLVMIESHSASHEIMTTLDDRELEIEVAGSYRALEHGLGRAPRFYCYPNGDHDDRVVAAVSGGGYRAAVTVRQGLVAPGAHPFRLPRLGVYRTTGPLTLASKLSGLSLRRG